MPKRFSRRILNHMADTRYEPRTIQQLAHDLNIPDDEFDLFRQAAEQLLEAGDIIRGSENTISLPPPGKVMIGNFRRHERGFGFIVPDELTEHGDLFVPPHQTMEAMTGDRVKARVIHDPRRGGGAKSPYVGEIVEILERADRQYTGTLFKRGKSYFVEVDGRSWHEPVYIGDPHAKNAKEGDKVVIELASYPQGNEPAEGVITEVLGETGEPDVETQAIMRVYGLKEQFPENALNEARKAARAFDGNDIPETREDCTDLFTLTIDPPEARDFDDAVTLRKLETREKHGNKAVYELGVHIADVSHFVAQNGELDAEALERGNSAYLPRRVIPMLPELLSNGVCSLQEGANRYAKSAFIQFDAHANVVSQRFANTVICSDKRLTYLEAQALIDNDLQEARKHAATEPQYSRKLSEHLQLTDELARLIRQRRRKQGMIALSLPEVELIFDDGGRVIDAQPEDDAFTHTIVEMFMVEANEAAARLFEAYRIPMLRRVHPDPDAHDLGDLQSFARVAGFNIPANPDRMQLQHLLESVRGKPAEHAVHLAVLKTLSKAEYAPLLIGHFALASEHYTHFTSPIRRYPDLVVHRGLDAMLEANNHKPLTAGLRFAPKNETKRMHQQAEDDPRLPDEQRLQEIGTHCSSTERNAESAEKELRNYLLLEMLTEHLGEDYEGTATGVTGSGLFVELDRFLVDGFVPVAELPTAKGDRWQLNPNTGALVAQRSGKTINIGDRFVVRVAQIDLARRRMELAVVEQIAARSHQGQAGLPERDAPQKGKGKSKKAGGKKAAGKKTGRRKQAKGAAKAHSDTQKLKQQQKQDQKTGRSKKTSRSKRGSKTKQTKKGRKGS